MSDPKQFHNVVCSKCGATAQSKCPYCRNVHQTDQTGQIECMLSYALKIEPATDENNEMTIKDFQEIKPYKELVNPETPEEALIKLHQWLGKMINEEDNFPSLTQFLCIHDWKFMEGKHSQINCGHG